MIRSPQCKKAMGYPTEDDAKEALLDVKIRRALGLIGHSIENGVYQCPFCEDTWHLTSKG